MSNTSLPTNSGSWEHIGDGKFILDPQIAVEVYRWHAPERFGSFVVEFQSPKEYPHRRFYPSEVLEALKRGESAEDYVDRMCRFGMVLLPELESVTRQILSATGNDDLYSGKEMPTPETLEFVLAIFESRTEGRQCVRRDFHREDDFFATEDSRKKDDFLVPGVKPPRRSPKSRLTGQDMIRHVKKVLHDNPPLTEKEGDQELALFQSPMRTPLDDVLVEGLFRNDDTSKEITISENAKRIAPALIDGIELDKDSRSIGEHIDEFRHFLRRLMQKFFSEPGNFCSWLRQEREKGFVRLLPGFKKLFPTDRESARDKGRRFFRRVLWTSYEAMSRCFGAVALYQWVSFFQSKVIRPSFDEQHAFRCYHRPQVFAGGLPLWFFGPNVLRWIMDDFIEKVWGWKEDQDFDSLTHLIGLYGQTAHLRRCADATKKRRKKVAQNRPDLLAESQRRKKVAQNRPDLLLDSEDEYPDFPASGVCPCGGRLQRIEALDHQGRLQLTESFILVDTECTKCRREKTYRIPRPS